MKQITWEKLFGKQWCQKILPQGWYVIYPNTLEIVPTLAISWRNSKRNDGEHVMERKDMDYFYKMGK